VSLLFWLSYVVMWFALLVLGLVQIDSWTKIARLRRRLAQVQQDVVGPSHAGGDAPSINQDTPWTMTLPGDWGLVLALRPSCESCHELATALAARVTRSPALPYTVLLEGAGADRFVEETGIDDRRVVRCAGVVLTRLGLRQLPAAIWVRDGQRTAQKVVGDPDELWAFVDTVQRELGPQAAVSSAVPAGPGPGQSVS
jgi:hypothetical protein